MNKKQAFIMIDALCALMLMLSVGLTLFIAIIQLEITYKKTLHNESELISQCLNK